MGSSILCPLIVHTANILGSFSDPFEFEGDYGPEITPIRQTVFEQLIPKQVLMQTLTDDQVAARMSLETLSSSEIARLRKRWTEEAKESDAKRGPTLEQLIPPSVRAYLIQRQHLLNTPLFPAQSLDAMLDFLDQYRTARVFRFLELSSSPFLGIDKRLRDQAAREGKALALPILSSTEPLKSRDASALKRQLIDRLFTIDHLTLALSPSVLEPLLPEMQKDVSRYLAHGEVSLSSLRFLTTPSGQLFFYLLYQSLHLHLIAQESSLVDQVNTVKRLFAETLGNPQARINSFISQLKAAGSSVVFTQEGNALSTQALLQEGFLPLGEQNRQDGTLVFLKKTCWEPHVQVLPIKGYARSEKGVLNVVLAREKATHHPFLLASAHGHSTHAEDARQQISLIMQLFSALRTQPEYRDLQLIIGIDANTKRKEDVAAFHAHLRHLGLIATQVGPTTVKRRMITVQHEKAGRYAVDEEDYLITLSPTHGGHYTLSHPTVGFSEGKRDPTVSLPNQQIFSDHYPVGATLVPMTKR